MLLNLHVKNLALVEEAEIEFGKGLNILTGETGAGKSIILGAVNLALGGKAAADMIGRYSDSAFVELTFLVESQERIDKLKEMDIFPEDGIITVSRRILPGRSVIKVNGETVTASLVKNITQLLIDIHGQHDHQSLLYKTKHLEILDKYAREDMGTLKEELAAAYSVYVEAGKKLEEFTISEEERNRNVSFISFEIEEIENAALKTGEDIEVEAEYRRIINSKKITDELAGVMRLVGSSDMNENASDYIGKANSMLGSVTEYDDRLLPIAEQLVDIENLLSDFNHDLTAYADSLDFDDETFIQTEKRLDEINNLKSKYGGTIEGVNEYLENARAKLEFYTDYETNLDNARARLEAAQSKVQKLCRRISEVRQKAAVKLEKQIVPALCDLNFEQVQFKVSVTDAAAPGRNGADEVEFLISVNPGEEVRPLAKIASGGELSRIMLGIKSVLAGRDEIDTLIFDEIDTGISGRTAQRVSEKMAVIAAAHQVICITHLPQIASMADVHFMIEKKITNGYTRTDIIRLSHDEMIDEIARMLGGMEITDIVRENAVQMKNMADTKKSDGRL